MAGSIAAARERLSQGGPGDRRRRKSKDWMAMESGELTGEGDGERPRRRGQRKHGGPRRGRREGGGPSSRGDGGDRDGGEGGPRRGGGRGRGPKPGDGGAKGRKGGGRRKAGS